MGKMVLLGDTGSHAGQMISASSTFEVDHSKVCLEGDLYQCDVRGHGVTSVHSHTSGPTCDGKQILHTGAVAECGCVLIGTASVEINA